MEVVHEDQPTEVVVEATPKAEVISPVIANITPPREQVNTDEECAIVSGFEEGGLIPTDEVVGCFSNEPNLEADYDMV